MVIRATFTGVNSLGYENNKEYMLKVSSNFLSIKRIDDSGKCVYHSLRAFFSNWDKVTVIKK